MFEPLSTSKFKNIYKILTLELYLIDILSFANISKLCCEFISFSNSTLIKSLHVIFFLKQFFLI